MQGISNGGGGGGGGGGSTELRIARQRIAKWVSTSSRHFLHVLSLDSAVDSCVELDRLTRRW